MFAIRVSSASAPSPVAPGHPGANRLRSLSTRWIAAKFGAAGTRSGTFTNIPSGRKASSLASLSQVEHLDGIHGL
jgi:hypothetical protein